MTDTVDALARARSEGRRVALVTVLAVEGDAPSEPGAKLVVAPAGEVLAGTLGCSEFDTAGRALAARALDAGGPLRVREDFPGHGRERALELFAEVYAPAPGVVVLGATPVGRAVVGLADLVGRRTVLLGNDAVDVLRASPPGPSDAVVLSDHDAPYVDDALRLLLAGDAGFVGMLGSRRHAPEVVARLRDAGVPAEQLARLRSPVGLDIGSRSASEIALSIVAQIVAEERGRSGGPLMGVS